jgi:xanthine/CO dehydrogenase XdhC/CoxF family maturation factor
MHELKDIIAKCKSIVDAGKRGALATVVRVVGSAYRRPGARMVIFEDGSTAGTISGGCLEADVALRAKEAIDTGEPLLLSYSSSGSDDDVVFGIGLGCNGRVDILVETLADGRLQAELDFIADCLATRQTGVTATIFNTNGSVTASRGDRLFLGEEHLGGVADHQLRQLISEDMQSALDMERSPVHHYGTESANVEVFMETVRPPIHLLICGAGPDTIPLSNLANQLGWSITIVDPRGLRAQPSSFPQADSVICCRPDELPKYVSVDGRTAAIVMTHNYAHDLAFLQSLAASHVRYLGLLGPKIRTNRLLQELTAVGSLPPQTVQLHAPVGLDIGAETSAEIALSIASEIQASFSGHSGGFLRNRQGAIHGQDIGSAANRPQNGARLVPLRNSSGI